ncbi:hypothetical protein GCK72_016921 [Caenorhabditis remanei]|uniref:Uncharacterized protein n=1 Tax=Caenorhabditis remanei TaxID=31234 RepID=A0A6A5G6Q2_CAERE|nr:hypothetical protein GCK72_016921 [Caenorhabditis remanei]KAF1750372.1 hypothetical protein GCK72_016921 [Caenorhabditis remanei]
MDTSINCTIMSDLSTSVFLKLSLSINLFICLCGYPVYLWASWVLWSAKNSKLLHVNFKIILQLHLFGFLFHCTGRIALHGMDLMNYMTTIDPCDMIPNIYRCFILRLMYNSGLWLTNSTAVSLILERWLATRRSVTYEEDTVLIGVFCAGVQFVVAALPLAFLYSQTRFQGVTMYYCVTAVTSAPYSAQVGPTVSIMFQVAALVSFHHLLRVNKVRIADAYEKQEPTLQKQRELNMHTSLSNRYQLEQNISSITCLKTFAAMAFVYIVFQNACYITLMQFAAGLEKYKYYAILEINGSWPLYGIISILVLARTMKKV